MIQESGTFGFRSLKKSLNVNGTNLLCFSCRPSQSTSSPTRSSNRRAPRSPPQQLSRSPSYISSLLSSRSRGDQCCTTDVLYDTLPLLVMTHRSLFFLFFASAACQHRSMSGPIACVGYLPPPLPPPHRSGGRL